MDEDIPLPADLPAAELKWAQCRVSWLQAAKDRSQAWASQAGAKTERDPKPPTSPLPLAPARSGLGHEDAFPPKTLSNRSAWVSRPSTGRAAMRRAALLRPFAPQTGNVNRPRARSSCGSRQ